MHLSRMIRSAVVLIGTAVALLGPAWSTSAIAQTTDTCATIAAAPAPFNSFPPTNDRRSFDVNLRAGDRVRLNISSVQYNVPPDPEVLRDHLVQISSDNPSFTPIADWVLQAPAPPGSAPYEFIVPFDGLYTHSTQATAATRSTRSEA